MKLSVATDGSCKRSGGSGGWAFLIADGEMETLGCGWDNETTNNRMELMGVIASLEYIINRIPESLDVVLVCDSEYVLGGIREWLANWRVRQWRTSLGKPVKNVDLWQRLDTALKQLNIETVHVRGHIGHPENEVCDTIATLAREHELSGMITQKSFDRNTKALRPYVHELLQEEA